MKFARVISAMALLATLSFLCFMALHGYDASKMKGAGAAQADLGFFFVLVVATVIVLGATACSLWIDSLARATVTKSGAGISRVVIVLTVLNFLALGWNWFFLAFLWKN